MVTGSVAGAGGQRPRIRRRRHQRAVGCDHAVGRQRGDLAFGVGGDGALVARKLHDAAQHLDEAAGDRQVRPCRLRRDVEEHQRALLAPRAGDQRRAVGKARPGALDDVGGRLGQHLPRDRDLARRRRGRANGPPAGNSVTGCGVVQDSAPPIERSPRRRRTGSRSSSLPAAASREPAKRTSVPPFLTQSTSCARAASGMVPTSAMTIIAGFCSRSCGIASARSGLDGSTRSAKGCSARRDVVERRQQRLRLVGLGLRQQADAAALGILVEHAHGGCLRLAVDGDRGKVVAQFEGHRHLAGAGRLARAEADGGVGDAAALVVEGAGGDLARRGIARRADGRRA